LVFPVDDCFIVVNSIVDIDALFWYMVLLLLLLLPLMLLLSLPVLS